MSALELNDEIDTLSDYVLQQRLAEFNARRFEPKLPVQDWRAGVEQFEDGALLEGAFLERERRLASQYCAQCPTDVLGFTAWFEGLRRTGPGQGDPLFLWLAQESTLDQMKWFLTQEVAGEAGFEDLTALTQVRLPTRVKLELARNYWDEMGRGQA